MPTRIPHGSAALFAAAFASLLFAAAPAHAGLLAPGEDGQGDDFVFNPGDPAFAGETLASRTAPIELTRVDDDTGETQTYSGTFNTRVVREPTGRLAFHYQFLRGTGNAPLDYENFVVGGFAGFETDVFSDQTSLTAGAASRSADGDSIDFVGDESADGNVVVRTNATAFDETGTARLVASFQPDAVDQFQSFTAFAPAADEPGPQPNPIPLPPAAWAALATMGGFGAVKRLRRRA